MNKFDMVEVGGDLIGAALTSKLAYKSFKTKVLISFVVGDALYIYMLRKKFFDALGETIAKNTGFDQSIDVNQMTTVQMLEDVGAKLLATYAVKVVANLLMNKGSAPFAGFKEMLAVNVGGQLAGRGARYIQMKYST